MSTISKFVLPVKVGDAVQNIEFDLPAGGSGGLPSEITNPQDGQLLKYDASEGVWINAGLSVSSENIGSASAGTAIAADDITGWTTNTPTRITVSGEKLIVTAGTAASLAYTARSIPNISVTSKNVVTGVSV